MIKVIEIAKMIFPMDRQFMPANELAFFAWYLTRRKFLDEKDLYILKRMGFEIEVVTQE